MRDEGLGISTIVVGFAGSVIVRPPPCAYLQRGLRPIFKSLTPVIFLLPGEAHLSGEALM